MTPSLKVRAVRAFYKPRRYLWAVLSWVYRAVFHRKYSKVELPHHLSADEASDHMEALTWTKDAVQELWDSMGTAHWVQHCLNEIDAGRGQPEGALDCDDFSAWAVAVLDPKLKPQIWCLSWVLPEGDIKGHAMCMGRDVETDEYFHVGNWGYMGPFGSFDAMVRATLKRAGAQDIVAWATLSGDLFPSETGLTYPGDKG